MALPPGWDVAAATADCHVVPWRGTVYRIHNSAFAGDSALGSRKGSGRYNVGLNSFPRKDADGYEPVRTAEEVEEDWLRYSSSGLVWEVLYTSSESGVAIAESFRQLGKDIAALAPERVVGFLSNRALSTLSVALTSALDCRIALRMSGQDRDAYLFGYSDYETGQSIASHALERGCDGLLIPSATGVPGFNVIPFVGKAGAEAVTLNTTANLHLVADDVAQQFSTIPSP